jgi:hypothetical protein
MNRMLAIAVIALIGLSGCQSADTSISPEGAASPTSGPEPSESPEPAGPPITLSDPDDAGVVTIGIDSAQLEPLFFEFNEQNASDPFWHIHTDQTDLYVGIELYTVYGAGWTGQLGTFALDCGASGICVYVDPDGAGPAGALGPASAGSIVITQLDDAGYDVTLTGVSFPGFALADLTLAG